LKNLPVGQNRRDGICSTIAIAHDHLFIARGSDTSRKIDVSDVAFHLSLRRRHPGVSFFRGSNPTRTCPCQRFTDALAGVGA